MSRAPPPTVNVAAQRVADFMTAINQLFRSTQFSDVKIRLGEVELPAHGFVLSAQTDYFARALASKFEEGATGTFQYDEGSMHAYWRCFKYIYTGEYAEEPAAELSVPDDDELSKEVRVYELAQYFGVKGLGEYSLDRFKIKIDKLWVSERFVDCIRDVYASTVDSDCKMRKAVVDVTNRHFSQLWDKPLQDLMREGGDFAVDLMEQVSR
ncbi:uncharacterized protein LMH87_008335 [Akanthomyces muscarius]|uniref:BTB domain-containing protein n=1 Tax=Akanthomyces muscarius TaxID=2231603 RepID=A0A9W8UN34_AKAMU|nr:uncharacterized protein LMH87_008335 [Akanthomyces muscarius]KAJ4159433.1 hypothetical protein LMH87_008335 [Akanthomyces muscarius]